MDIDRLLRRWFGPRYWVVQRAGIKGEGRELERFDYFGRTRAQEFANSANKMTSHSCSSVEPATRD